MSRPNAALVAEFYPEVEVRGDLGERSPCSRSRRPNSSSATDPRTVGATGDVLDERGRGSSSVWLATSALPAAIFSSVRSNCPSRGLAVGRYCALDEAMPRNVAVVEANLRRQPRSLSR